MQFFDVADVFLDLRCGLSESPIYESVDNVLRFVDIIKKRVFRIDLNKGHSSLQMLQYEDAVCVTANLAFDNDKFIFGGKYGIGIGEKSTTKNKLIIRFWSKEEEEEGKPHKMRANDGAVDSTGRFWVGVLRDPESTECHAADGIIFRFDQDGSLHRMLGGLTCPNGISWSLDNTTMYVTDSAEGKIFAFDFDEKSGNISNKRDFFTVERGSCPDGHAQDIDGHLWVAIWGAWKVVRVNPEGQVTAEIPVPTRCPTAVAFVGEELYITSEEEQEPGKYPESLKYHGGVFKCYVGVRGREPLAVRYQF